MWPFKKKTELRADPVIWDDPVLQAMFGSGTLVTKEMALQVPTVSGGVDLIGGIVSGTPIKLYRDEDGKAIELADDYRLRLLNDEPGDTLNANDFWRAMVRDYYTGKGGYAYIAKTGGRVRGLYYVDEVNVSIVRNTDPIFKDYDLLVGGARYKPFDFLKILRNTRDGAEGVPITTESSKLIAVAYASLILELNMARRGGNKKGFLRSDKRIDEASLQALKAAFAKLFSGDTEGSDNFVVLNNGIDFKESSNTSVELQLNENKRANALEFAKLFHISADVMEGRTGNTESLAKLAAIPLMTAIQCALNRDLLLESEKGRLYFAFDTKELLKGDMTSRFAAYKTALDANFMQVDEVRYKEDMEPLGLDWIKLGLQDVLYNPKTKQVFAPNTGKVEQLGEGLQEDAADDTMEQRARYNRDDKGRFTNSSGGGSGGGRGGKTKYSPSKQRNHSEVQLGAKTYARLCGTLNTRYPGLKAGDVCDIIDSGAIYSVTADGFGGMTVQIKRKIANGRK